MRSNIKQGGDSMPNIKNGRSTVYNEITSEEKLKKVNRENIDLEKDFLEYLVSTDRAKSTLKQYESILHVFWCWNLDYNGNVSFLDLKKRQIARFQNHALNEWGWSPSRIRMVKSVCRSLENFIINVLDDDYPDYRKIWDKIESPTNEAVRVKTVLKPEELENFLKMLIDKKKYMQACWVALGMYSGRRKAELCRFKVSYFDDNNLICDGALYKTPEKMTTKGRGKRGKMLDVYTLAKPFKPYLDLWLNYREQNEIKGDWLFPKHKGGEWLDEPMSPTAADSWSRSFSRILNVNFYPHMLRHHFTTSLSEQGIPDNVIKDIVGWSDVGLVDVYRDTEAEDTFEKYFGAEGIKQVEKKSLSDL